MLRFFYKKKFPTLAALTTASDITILRSVKTTSKIWQFFKDSFENIVAPIAKNFGFLGGVVFKIFAFKLCLKQTQR